MKKKFMGEEEYREYLDRMFESAKKMGATQERLKDSKQEDLNDIELHIAILADGFKVYQNNKTFICQTGEQLVNYLITLPIAKSQLLDIYKTVLSECMKYDIDFPTDLIW